MKYEILEEESSAELQRAVMQMINKGWKPHGGIVIVTNSKQISAMHYVNFLQYLQAMIKKPN